MISLRSEEADVPSCSVSQIGYMASMRLMKNLARRFWARRCFEVVLEERSKCLGSVEAVRWVRWDPAEENLYNLLLTSEEADKMLSCAIKFKVESWETSHCVRQSMTKRLHCLLSWVIGQFGRNKMKYWLVRCWNIESVKNAANRARSERALHESVEKIRI